MDDMEWARKQWNEVTHPQAIEALGASVTTPQAIALIKVGPDKNQLSNLLSGIPQAYFSELLNDATCFEVFKREVALGSIQHHLTLLNNALQIQVEEIDNQLSDWERKIDQLVIENWNRNDDAQFEQEMLLLESKINTVLDLIDKGLLLAWNSARTDLIEKLSAKKEHLKRIVKEAIGDKKVPSGIFLRLDNRLFSVYGEASNYITMLSEDTPVLEGLAYIGIKDSEDVQKIAKLLDQLHLKNVGDLKSARIYSKATLLHVAHARKLL